jgi:hypothetical protein
MCFSQIKGELQENASRSGKEGPTLKEERKYYKPALNSSSKIELKSCFGEFGRLRERQMTKQME